jgi:eukaryotic-like serine/threonine-protein kinase
MIGKTLGHYRVVQELGRGGMGEVYLADDLNLNRKVALKFLPEIFTGDPERMARFEREAKLLASLNHPNIAAIYGLEQAEGKRFLVLELVEGETLQEYVKRAPGRAPLHEILAIARQIADALEAAHEKGVIHRDLKPANVMINEGSKVKVLDFGLAKALSEELQSVDSSQSPTLTEAMTRPGVILGTAAYMSPEQAKGKAVDKRADIWAFGCILYECLTGKRAFEGETVTETLAAVLKNEPDWNALPATTPPNIRFVLRRCLEKDLSRRFHCAADVRIQIEAAGDAGEVTAPARRPWLAWSFAAVFLVAFAAVSFLYFRAKPTTSSEAIHLQIVPTAKPSVGSLFAISPDGRKLVFMAAGSDGDASLWVRGLDSAETRPLPGTASPAPVFWSPDSRYVAFWTGTQIKKIAISGGPAQTLCNYRNLVIGGSWNRDGTILFGSNTPGLGLMRISASGGSVYPVTTTVAARQETSHKYPLFLPDGRHFLYWRNSRIPENNGLYVGSLDAKPEEQDLRQLMTVTHGTAYVLSGDSHQGQLLFLREGMLLAQSFDDKRMQLAGEPVAVADRVGSMIDSGYFSVSTNGILVYRSGGVSPFSQPSLFNRKGESLGTLGASGIYLGLALSPDGSQAAASLVDMNRYSQDIWLLNTLRGISTRFTFDKSSNHNPIWSPDGSRIAFASDRDGGVYNLYQKMSSGVKTEELLLKSGENKQPTSWSPDGRFLLYGSQNGKTKGDLWVLPLEGDRKPIPFLRSEFNEFDAHFSPDMRWIAYVSDESGGNEIYVQALSKTSAGNSVETGGKWLVSKGGGIGPRWRGDSKELYYTSADGNIMVVEVAAGTAFQAATPKPLFKLPYQSFAISSISEMASVDCDVSADGNRFLLLSDAVESSPSPFNLILNWTALLKK